MSAHWNVPLTQPCERMIEPVLAIVALCLHVLRGVPRECLQVVLKYDTAEAFIHDGTIALPICRRIIEPLGRNCGTEAEGMPLQHDAYLRVRHRLAILIHDRESEVSLPELLD